MDEKGTKAWQLALYDIKRWSKPALAYIGFPVLVTIQSALQSGNSVDWRFIVTALIGALIDLARRFSTDTTTQVTQ